MLHHNFLPHRTTARIISRLQQDQPHPEWCSAMIAGPLHPEGPQARTHHKWPMPRCRRAGLVRNAWRYAGPDTRRPPPDAFPAVPRV